MSTHTVFVVVLLVASTRTVRVHADPLRTPKQTLTVVATGALYTFLRQPEPLGEYPDGHRTSANAGSAPGAKPSGNPPNGANPTNP